MALAKGVKEGIWLKRLIDDMGMNSEITTVFCDSQSVIHLSKNQAFHVITKRIDLRYTSSKIWCLKVSSWLIDWG